jgi:hypothetical protein
MYPVLEITYRRTAPQAFRRMEPGTARRIRERIRAVAANLTSRALFDMDDETLDVLAIETRGEAYKPRRRR